MIWEDLVTRRLAAEQRAWERRRMVRRMISLGISRKAIAERLGVTRSTVHDLYHRSLRDRGCPIIRHMNALALDLAELARI
jgi:transposase-like protein